jgi:hypothetical protein
MAGVSTQTPAMDPDSAPLTIRKSLCFLRVVRVRRMVVPGMVSVMVVTLGECR